jgi:hypothetical protein
MLIVDYLAEVEYATQNLIPLIWEERNRLEKLKTRLASLGRVVEDNYRRAEFIQLNAETPEDVMMGVGAYWDNYFGEDKELFHGDEEKLNNQILAHAFSIDSLAGNLLQHAKQGISLAHGKLANCPDGRYIGSQPLKEVVWQGRNQALHWEDHNPHPPVKKCFDNLAQDIDPKFADYAKRNMAFDVVDLLGWRDFDSFKRDMLLLS